MSDALHALVGVRHARVDAVELAPRKPGLYAFYGDEVAWKGLSLAPAFEGQPRYVGKAEKSLNGRDVGTHLSQRQDRLIDYPSQSRRAAG